MSEQVHEPQGVAAAERVAHAINFGQDLVAQYEAGVAEGNEWTVRNMSYERFGVSKVAHHVLRVIEFVEKNPDIAEEQYKEAPGVAYGWLTYDIKEYDAGRSFSQETDRNAFIARKIDGYMNGTPITDQIYFNMISTDIYTFDTLKRLHNRAQEAGETPVWDSRYAFDSTSEADAHISELNRQAYLASQLDSELGE